MPRMQACWQYKLVCMCYMHPCACHVCCVALLAFCAALPASLVCCMLQPLSLEELLKKKKEEQELAAKVRCCSTVQLQQTTNQTCNTPEAWRGKHS